MHLTLRRRHRFSPSLAVVGRLGAEIATLFLGIPPAALIFPGAVCYPAA